MFIDRRFGEYDEKMTLEDKMMKRFTMEKKVILYRNIWLEYFNLHTVLDKILIFHKLSYGTLASIHVPAVGAELASQGWKYMYMEGKWN